MPTSKKRETKADVIDPEAEADQNYIDTQPEDEGDAEEARATEENYAPSDVELPEPDEPPSLTDQLAALMASDLSEDEALLIVSKRRGLTTQQGAAASPGGDLQRNQENDFHEQARQEQLAAFQAKMATYVPPKLDETYEVTLPVRFADYVRKIARWEGAARRREVSTEEAIQLIVRQHWQVNPEKRLLDHPNSATGPAGAFDPKTGTYQL